MALKKCKECGKEVSSKAKTCPHCGAPVKHSDAAKGCLALVVLLCMCLWFGSCSREQKQDTPQPTAFTQARAAPEKRPEESFDQFMAALKKAGINGSSIKKVRVEHFNDYKLCTITVANAWHLNHYQLRLQAAQNLWELWASIASPSAVDKARLKLVDLNGNEVGGSRALAGSLIWVQD